MLSTSAQHLKGKQDLVFSSYDCHILHTFVMHPPLGAGGIMFCGLSVRPSEARNTIFPPVHGSIGPSDQSWPFYGMSVCLSVRRGFRAFAGERMEGMAWNFVCWCCRGHLQNWLDSGHGVLIFLLMAPLSLSETGQIWGFGTFPRECMKGIGCNVACRCILTTFRTD